MHIKSPMALMGCLLALAGAALAAAPIMLVKDGRPAATTVIADQPTAILPGKRDPKTKKGVPMTQMGAAEELQALIEKATGARLEIVPAAEALAAGTLLLVGRSALSEQSELALPTKPEGLRIITFARGVAILGEVAPAGMANRGRGRESTWMAKMKPPWDWPMRCGTLTFAAARYRVSQK